MGLQVREIIHGSLIFAGEPSTGTNGSLLLLLTLHSSRRINHLGDQATDKSMIIDVKERGIALVLPANEKEPSLLFVALVRRHGFHPGGPDLARNIVALRITPVFPAHSHPVRTSELPLYPFAVAQLDLEPVVIGE